MASDNQQHDEAWKRIQQNTFTRWVRKKLEPVDVPITNLATDFEEGLKLIRLVELLSGKSLGRHNKKVIFRHQKLENISLALRFLEEEEHIKLVNIDSSAIVDRNLKLILGLVWTLILHYSISKQIWDDQPNGETSTAEMPAREKLMHWIRAKLPAQLSSFTNFTTDWNSGILLGALVNSCAPDLEIGWQKWSCSEALQSTVTAMQLASIHLGVAALIAPEELINPAVDEKSVMTYLSQFPCAKYTPPLGQLRDVDMMPPVGVSTRFTLLVRDAMVTPEVVIRGPDGSPVLVTHHQLSETIHEFKYHPKTYGEYEIIATVRDNASGDSAQLTSNKVMAGKLVDLSSIQVNGLNDGVATVGWRKDISIDIGDLKPGKDGLKVFVEERKKSPNKIPNRKLKMVIPLKRDDKSTVYRGFWTPKNEGEVAFVVLFDHNLVGEYHAVVVRNAARCRAFGEGLEQAVVGMEAKFTVDVKAAHESELEVTIKGPSGVETDANVTYEPTGLYKVSYIPQDPGIYQLIICYGDKEEQIPGSPFSVLVDYKRDPSRVQIHCDEICVRAGIPVIFTVSAMDTALQPISARLPSGFEQPVVEELKARLYRVTFIPDFTANGALPLEIFYGSEYLGSINFTVIPQETKEIPIWKIGPGVPLPPAEASFLYSVLFNIPEAKKIDEVSVEVKGPDGKMCKSKLVNGSNNELCLLKFVPDIVGTYLVMVYYNGKKFLPEPCELAVESVGSANKCFIELLPADKLWTVDETKVVVVNTKNGGRGSVSILSDKDDLETSTVYKDGIYQIMITPRSEGQNRIVVMYGGNNVPGGEFNFECVPSRVRDWTGQEEAVSIRTVNSEGSEVNSEGSEENQEEAISKGAMNFEWGEGNQKEAISKRTMRSERGAENQQEAISETMNFEQDEESLVLRTFRFSITSEYQFEKLTASVKTPSGKDDIAGIEVSIGSLK